MRRWPIRYSPRAAPRRADPALQHDDDALGTKERAKVDFVMAERTIEGIGATQPVKRVAAVAAFEAVRVIGTHQVFNTGEGVSIAPAIIDHLAARARHINIDALRRCRVFDNVPATASLNRICARTRVEKFSARVEREPARATADQQVAVVRSQNAINTTEGVAPQARVSRCEFCGFFECIDYALAQISLNRKHRLIVGKQRGAVAVDRIVAPSGTKLL